MTGLRLTSAFWVAAKLRQLQSAGGYASILVKGNNEAGAINLVLRVRDGRLRIAVPAVNSMGQDRIFEWHEGFLNEHELSAFVERELRFDRDQWFVECECSELHFSTIFALEPS